MDKPAMIAFFDSLASQWDELSIYEEAKLRCLVELFSPPPGARILDVACGTGILEPVLLEKQPSQILAVDFSPAMIERAKEKLREERVEFRCVDVMDIDREEFDCAIIYEAFPHFQNRGSLTRQMHHLLTEKGRLMICHCQSRTQMNSHYKENAAGLFQPLPAAQTLSTTLSQYFDVDIMIDSPSFYVVSGLRRSQ